MTPLLVLTAVELEARVLARELELPLLRAFPFPAFGHATLRVAPVGLRAALCESRWASLLDGFGAPLVVSAGVCGALDPRLAPGDLVIPERVIDARGASYQIGVSHHREALSRLSAPACTDPLVTSNRVVATTEAKASLFASSGAAAVDMESAIIIERAARSAYPALVVRAVSDDSRQSLPAKLVGLVDSEGRLRVARALALTVTRPMTLPSALGLGRRTRRALRAVARVLAGLIA
jgi:adenosylhomocysteine nucleosidase